MLGARVIGWPTVFDLEDGEILSTAPGGPIQQSTTAKFGRRILIQLYDRFCRRALLAARGLASHTSVRPVLQYYGSVSKMTFLPRKAESKIHFLFSGTVTHQTGSRTLSRALLHLQRENPVIAQSIVVHVTGVGDGIKELGNFAATNPEIEIIVYGRLSQTEFKAVLQKADVGLSLKKVKGEYADSTFPSKTVEYAAAGLYVITTDISDVRHVLGEQATYLTSDSPSELAAAIAAIVSLGRAGIEPRSRALQDRIMHTLSYDSTGKELSLFLAEALDDNA